MSEILWFFIGLGIGQEYPNLPSVRQVSKIILDNIQEWIQNNTIKN